MRGVEVFGGVLVFGRVAAADMAAFETQPEMHPDVAHFEAFFAAHGVRLYFFDLPQVSATGSHGISSPYHELEPLG
jgi:hypothetical protein